MGAVISILIVGTIIAIFLWLAAHPERHPKWLQSRDSWVSGWVPPRDRQVVDRYENELRRRFAEQWSQHPTLSKRQAAARKKSLKRRKG